MIILFNGVFDQELGNEKIFDRKINFGKSNIVVMLYYIMEKRTSNSGSACIRNRFIMNKVC